MGGVWFVPVMEEAPLPAQPVSFALLAANERLLGLRAQWATRRDSEAMPTLPNLPVVAQHLPPHLGWGSERLTAVLRRNQPLALELQIVEAPPEPPAPSDCSSVRETPSTPTVENVAIYPDIALACLRDNGAGAGRVWFLLRHLDTQGRGWLAVETVRTWLTGKDSAWHVCGWRQLRNILKAGEGVFWMRSDSQRLWLRSPAKVALSLGVERLRSWPVGVPLTVMVGKLGLVKAHFFASFHSGRRPSPISRQTLNALSNVPPRTQRTYDKTAGLQAKSNFALGALATPESLQTQSWLHGPGVFTFIDFNGRQGPRKRRYVAWHLPNSYEACHTRNRKGRWRKINQQIGLVQERARGNKRQRVFCANGAKAVQVYNRHADEQDTYWPQPEPATREKQASRWWYVLPKME